MHMINEMHAVVSEDLYDKTNYPRTKLKYICIFVAWKFLGISQSIIDEFWDVSSSTTLKYRREKSTYLLVQVDR